MLNCADMQMLDTITVQVTAQGQTGATDVTHVPVLHLSFALSTANSKPCSSTRKDLYTCSCASSAVEQT